MGWWGEEVRGNGERREDIIRLAHVCVCILFPHLCGIDVSMLRLVT